MYFQSNPKCKNHTNQWLIRVICDTQPSDDLYHSLHYFCKLNKNEGKVHFWPHGTRSKIKSFAKKWQAFCLSRWTLDKVHGVNNQTRSMHNTSKAILFQRNWTEKNCEAIIACFASNRFEYKSMQAIRKLPLLWLSCVNDVLINAV